MRKDLIIGVGIPAVIFMILIGSDGHSSFDFEEYGKIISGEIKQLESVSPQVDVQSSSDCNGNAQCFVGTVTKIIDGDTSIVDGQSVRFALSSAPELKAYGES